MPREDRAALRIGDVIDWRNLDARVAKVLAEQTTVQRFEDDLRHRVRRTEVGPPKQSRPSTCPRNRAGCGDSTSKVI